MKRVFLFGAMIALLFGCNNTTKNNIQKVADTPSVEEPIPAETPEAEPQEVTPKEVVEPTTLRFLDAAPADYQEGDAFGFVLQYGDYAMDAGVWPMPDDDWLVTWHWCMEEDGGIFTLDENGNAVEKVYVDPFEGRPYPVVHHPELSFDTRNYGGETINFYAASDSDEILCSTNYMQISLDVITADLKTRRVLVRTNPNDWCWGEPEDEFEVEFRHPFVDLQGWVDEEWVCGSTVTTCP